MGAALLHSHSTFDALKQCMRHLHRLLECVHACPRGEGVWRNLKEAWELLCAVRDRHQNRPYGCRKWHVCSGRRRRRAAARAATYGAWAMVRSSGRGERLKAGRRALEEKLLLPRRAPQAATPPPPP